MVSKREVIYRDLIGFGCNEQKALELAIRLDDSGKKYYKQYPLILQPKLIMPTGGYYVSLYHLYAIYEPAEGGYFYEGVALIESRFCRSYKTAKRKIRKKYKEAVRSGDTVRTGWEESANKQWFGWFDPEKTGSGWFIQIERKPGKSESGWKPYE